MNTNPQPGFTAELAERTVVVTWPDNERGGATPPPDGWADHALDAEPTLHEVDEGSITGCSVLRWRDDRRSDAELIAVSLALVTGAPAVVSSPPDTTTRDRVAESLYRHDWPLRQVWVQALPDDRQRYTALADAVLAALPPTDRAAILLWAADAVATLDRRKLGIEADTIRDAWEEGRDAGATELRRLAAEAQQPETEAEAAATLARECTDHAAVILWCADRVRSVDDTPAVRDAADYLHSLSTRAQVDTASAPNRPAIIRECAQQIHSMGGDADVERAAEYLDDLANEADEAAGVRQQPDTETPCSNCGHLSCDGNGPCAAILNVGVLQEHRCPCTGPPAVVSQPGKETQDGRCPACGHTVCDGDGPCGALSGDDFCRCPGGKS